MSDTCSNSQCHQIATSPDGLWCETHTFCLCSHARSDHDENGEDECREVCCCAGFHSQPIDSNLPMARTVENLTAQVAELKAQTGALQSRLEHRMELGKVEVLASLDLQFRLDASHARLEQLRARLAAAERERDRLAVEVDEVNARHGRVREAALETQRQLTAERATTARLVEALKSFAAHRDGCRHHRDGPETCDCGLDAARTAAPEPKEPM